MPAGLTRISCRFDLLLHVMHHGHGSNQNDGCNDLVRVEAGMEEAPSDAYRGEGLHHLEVTRCGCAREMQPLKVNQKRNPA